MRKRVRRHYVQYRASRGRMSGEIYLQRDAFMPALKRPFGSPMMPSSINIFKTKCMHARKELGET